jgi:hypothetical protein
MEDRRYSESAEPGYPIWPPYEAFYISSMLFNTQSAYASIGAVASVIDHIANVESDDPFTDIDQHSVLNELQNVVVQGAAVSRYFWPIRKGHEQRAKQLRSAFNITEESPLFSRSLRNDIEHLDEKLDRYLATGITGHILPEYFGPSSQSPGVPIHFFRAYFLDVGEFQLLDKRYKIQPLADAIADLHQALEQRDGRGGRI